MICNGLGPKVSPSHVAMLNTVPVLFNANPEFDAQKFSKAMADPAHWVVTNLRTRFDIMCAMLAIISAELPPTSITIWGPEVRGAVRPVLNERFAPIEGVPNALALNGTGTTSVCSPNHPSACTAAQCPTTKPKRDCARPARAQAPRPDACASESRTRASSFHEWRRDGPKGH
jgi:hypothetical protein